MNLPEPILQQIIDSSIYYNISFAIYRLPWTDEPQLVLQESCEPEILDSVKDLNGKQGFVMFPFKPDKQHQGVLIHAEQLAHSWEEIGKIFQRLILSANKKPVSIDIRQEEALNQKIDETTEKASYFLAFHRFIAPLQQREFQKLVLSRQTKCQLDEGFSPIAAFVHACNRYPRMMVSFCHTPQTGTWIGSTPEIILSGHEKQWSTVALAGTMPMDGENLPGEWDKKNYDEQAFVAEYIRRILKRTVYKIEEKGPYTARAGQLVHLKTDFRFQLKETSHLGNLLAELHPTPAVCGLPKQETYDFIHTNEGYNRSYYSGIIGWLDPSGDTHLYINLRCMNIDKHTATLYAGGGILATSTAETEWEETQEKMKTMKQLLL